MRRIMIARRNNLKVQSALLQARVVEAQKRKGAPRTGTRKKNGAESQKLDNDDQKMVHSLKKGNPPEALPGFPPFPSNPSGTKRRRIAAGVLQPTDGHILEEMDVPAVEATRSYRKWRALPEGSLFVYNQTYIRGHADHDWLLRKNIWRRMRYRRENRAKIAALKNGPGGLGAGDWTTCTAKTVNDTPAEKEEEKMISKAVVAGAAAAAAQVEAFEPGIAADAVAALGANDPVVSLAMDAARIKLVVAELTNAQVGENIEGGKDVENVDVIVEV